MLDTVQGTGDLVIAVQHLGNISIMHSAKHYCKN